MASETPEETFVRFQAEAQRFSDALNRAVRVALTAPDADQREFARQAIPLWEREIANWAKVIDRLRREIADEPVGGSPGEI